MVLNVKIEGLNQAMAALLKQGTDKFEKINAAIHKQGLLLEGEIKQSIAGHRGEPRSVDTGHFLQSVNTRNEHLSSIVNTNVLYSVYLEKGTRYIEARRHFENSATRQRKQIIDAIERSVK